MSFCLNGRNFEGLMTYIKAKHLPFQVSEWNAGWSPGRVADDRKSAIRETPGNGLFPQISDPTWRIRKGNTCYI